QWSVGAPTARGPQAGEVAGQYCLGLSLVGKAALRRCDRHRRSSTPLGAIGIPDHRRDYGRLDQGLRPCERKGNVRSGSFEGPSPFGRLVGAPLFGENASPRLIAKTLDPPARSARGSLGVLAGLGRAPYLREREGARRLQHAAVVRQGPRAGTGRRDRAVEKHELLFIVAGKSFDPRRDPPVLRQMASLSEVVGEPEGFGDVSSSIVPRC